MDICNSNLSSDSSSENSIITKTNSKNETNIKMETIEEIQLKMYLVYSGGVLKFFTNKKDAEKYAKIEGKKVIEILNETEIDEAEFVDDNYF